MKPGLRLIMLIMLVACGMGLVASLYLARVDSPMQSTLASSFQLLGTPVKILDRMMSRVVPVNELDERELGDITRQRYDTQVTSGDADQAYLDALIVKIKPFTHKPFPYRAYVISTYGEPNAIALPGGVILVTKELLDMLHSESELVAVLAHEIGHIEQGHCFDTVRFQLLTRKIGTEWLGALADLAVQILLSHAYSKISEDEADEYAYELLVSSRYDPLGVGESFGSLRQYMKSAGAKAPQHAQPIRDYFMSHPPLEIREAQFSERAEAWWKWHPGEQRYVGHQNLLDRKALGTLNLRAEWKSVEKESPGKQPSQTVIEPRITNIHPFIRRWDRDGDRKVSRGEFAGIANFDRLDQNGDGFIDENETLALGAKGKGGKKGKRKGKVKGLTHEEFVAMYDRDGNGDVSVNEYIEGPKGGDKDGKGKIPSKGSRSGSSPN